MTKKSKQEKLGVLMTYVKELLKEHTIDCQLAGRGNDGIIVFTVKLQ